MQSALFIFILGIIPSLISALCKPPYITFRNKKKGYFRRIPFIVEIDVDKCPGLPILYYKWKLTHAGAIVGDRTYRDFMVRGYEQVPYDTAFTKATTLSVSVSHYENFAVSSEATLEIDFVPEPFHLELVGGNKRIYSDEKDIILDATSFSYDPSYSPDETDLFSTYAFEWTSTPPIDSKFLQAMTVNIPQETFMKNESYNMSITVTRDPNRLQTGFYYRKSVSQIIIFRPQTTSYPGFTIICVYNCGEYPNYKEYLIVEITCVYNCENAHLKWIWHLDPSTKKQNTQFGTGHNKLLIEGQSYKPNEIIEIQASNGQFDEIKKIQYGPPIKDGNCFAKPGEGVSGVTLFKITCEAFHSVAGIKKYGVYQKDEADEGIMIYNGVRLDEQEVFLAPGNPAILMIIIEDESFLVTRAEIKIKVRSLEVRLNDLKIIVLGRSAYSLHSLLQKRQRHQMVQTVSFVLEALKIIANVTEVEKKTLYRYMVKYASALDPRDFLSVIQWLTMFEKVRKFYNTSIDTFTTRYVAKNLESSLEVMQYVVFYNLEPTSFRILELYLNRIFNILTFLMKPIDDVKKYLSITLAPHEYDTYDEMAHDRLEIRDNLRQVTESCFRSLEMIRNLLMHFAFVEQREVTFSTNIAAYSARKILPKNMPAYLTIRNISNSRVHFSNKLRNFLVKTYSSISYYFVIFSYDPFWWHLNISDLTTDKVLCGIYHEREKITVVPAPFYVTLAMKEKSFSKVEGTVTDASPFNINVHRIILTTRNTISIFFEETSENFHARFSDCYCGPEDMKNAKLIKKDSFERERVLHYETKGGIAFLCIQRLGFTDLSYVGWIKHFECMYWDLERGNFLTEGIDVSQLHAHPDDNLVCASFHFSLFLGKATLPVHYLNTPVVMDFYITFSRNVYVIILVAVLLFIWLILLYWAVFKDREFAKRDVVCKLDDNVPGDQHIYLVVVFTGIFIDAGTTADVAFQLKGEQSESRVHLIKCCDMSLLKRNSQDWFIIYTPEYLGPIKTIRLWHNSRGSEPHWYCQRIIVQHLESGYQYCFIVDDWLSLIWGTGKIYHEIPVQHWMEMQHWKALFAVKLEKLKEDHLWVSVIGRQSQSNFNNKERVSTAIAAIFLSMLACAFLFGYPHGVPSDSIDPQTKYFITPDTITIFTESWLISIPVIVFVIFIFKNSAP